MEIGRKNRQIFLALFAGYKTKLRDMEKLRDLRHRFVLSFGLSSEA